MNTCNNCGRPESDHVGGYCPSPGGNGHFIPSAHDRVLKERVKALLDQKSREELFRHARVLAEFAKTAPGRLPQRIQDAIKAVETLQL